MKYRDGHRTQTPFERMGAGLQRGLMLVLPPLTVGICGYFAVAMASPDVMAWWLALPLGLLVGLLLLAVGLFCWGTDVVVPSLVIISLVLVLLPGFRRAKENEKRQEMMRRQQQAPHSR